MAQRRMFSLKVIDTDSFLDMSPTAQNLYFHLGMRADDDGFVASPKKIMKMVSAPDDDMKVLIAKGFIVPMSTNGVCVISHWKINNLIKSDRYSETIYLEEKARLVEKNGVYSVDILGSKMVPLSEPQVRLGKDRIGKDKDNAEQSSAVAPFNWKDYLKEMEDDKRRSINIIGHYFEEKGLKFSSRSEAAVAIKRHLRAANSVAAFSDDKIVWATDKAKKDYGELFTIETVLKMLTR
ncbi:MAG: replisome organizer [Candidatus Doudnabacteria bacterium]|nr:replisome organizer [Candidatus Doudnabacteria bacterium]